MNRDVLCISWCVLSGNNNRKTLKCWNIKKRCYEGWWKRVQLGLVLMPQCVFSFSAVGEALHFKLKCYLILTIIQRFNVTNICHHFIETIFSPGYQN